IGNPPYGFHQIHTSEIKHYFKARYSASKGSYEHYFIFYEAALKLLREEGCGIDAVSEGEVRAAFKAGYKSQDIIFTGNNISDSEMKYVISQNVLVNVDSLSQLERFGRMNPKSNVAVRINPDVGSRSGHRIRRSRIRLAEHLEDHPSARSAL
ncbi:MAG: hypothetical protein IIB54_09765, partial [Planctomycetes bacterium]|nr:hypothetical protein [Planctomycetota bacterium]